MDVIDADWLRARLSDSPRGTRARLAEALGIPADQVSKIVSKDRRIQPDETGKIAKFFGLQAEFMSEAEAGFLRAYREAPPDRRSIAETVLRTPPPAKTE